MGSLLKGKSILITGGSSGIGKSTAFRCAQEGANVVVADKNQEEGQNCIKEISEAGFNATFITTDVTQGSDILNAIDYTTQKYGQLDGAFNNAGVEGVFSNITKISEEDFDRTQAVNVKGVWLSVKFQIECFLRQNTAGSIVNTASVAGLVGTRGGSAYCASKHAVVGLTKSTALEFAKKNIRVNAVCPGIIETPMLQRMIKETGMTQESVVNQEPLGRLGMPSEIAESVVWLLSSQASFVTGIALPVDGGYTAI